MRRTLLLLVALAAAAPNLNAQHRAAPLLPHAPHTLADVSLEPTEPLARLIPADCDTDRAKGREAAGTQHSATGWFAGGFVSGVVLGLIGTAVTWAIANSSTPQPNGLPDGVEPSCYREGYSARAKGTNAGSALIGGLLGTLVFVVLYVSATSGSVY